MSHLLRFGREEVAVHVHRDLYRGMTQVVLERPLATELLKTRGNCTSHSVPTLEIRRRGPHPLPASRLSTLPLPQMSKDELAPAHLRTRTSPTHVHPHKTPKTAAPPPHSYRKKNFSDFRGRVCVGGQSYVGLWGGKF